MTLGIRYRIRNIIAAYPRLYFPIYRLLRSRRHGLLSPTTQLTMEGFPRSGNSFALRAFESVNPDVEIGHHTHAAAQVIDSVRRKLPTLVLIRDPVAAVRSLLIMRPEIPPPAAVLSYLQFYRPLEQWLEQFVLATFEEVIADFGEVTRRINRRFATDFEVFAHTPENVAAIFQRIEDLELRAGGGILRNAKVARPDAVRERLKMQVSLEHWGELIEQASWLYHDFLRKRSPA